MKPLNNTTFNIFTIYTISIFFLTLLILLGTPTQSSWAAAEQMVGIKVPPTISKGLFLFDIEHRFYGPLQGDVADNFFGLDDGANIDFNLGYAPSDDTMIDFHRVRSEKEYVVNLAHTFVKTKDWNLGLGVSYFNYKPILATSRIQNTMEYMVVQPPELFGFMQSYINVAYDGQYQTIGGGLGLDLAIKDDLSLILESYTTNQKLGKYAAGLIGLRYKTFGHQFTVMFENTPEIGLRRVMTGSETNNYSLGFSIHRVLEL